jgi:hypothetical protein
MKKMIRLFPALVLSVILINATSVYAGNDKDRHSDTLNFKSYYGKVVDAATNASLPFAAIELEGSNVSTVTNIDGEFTLKVPKSGTFKSVKISYLGYLNRFVLLTEFKDSKSLTLRLEPTSVQMQAITIRPGDPSELIAKILSNVDQNYSLEPMLMKAFYRETIKNRKNYVAISEAVVDIFKSPYKTDFQTDQVKMERGRKSADVAKMDTVLVKLKGGPAISLLLDIVKHPYVLLTDEYKKVYDFLLNDIISLDDRLHYVISFNQKEDVEQPFYQGKLYVEMESLAITEAEFELNVENSKEAEMLFVQKKPLGMSITPEKAVYRTKYVIDNGKWYFNYARAEVKFKVDWKKKLFNSYYTTMSEIAVTDRTNEGVERFAMKDRLTRNDILDNLVYSFFDADYWGEYNVIEPDQSIESAIRKLNKKFRQDEE